MKVLTVYWCLEKHLGWLIKLEEISWKTIKLNGIIGGNGRIGYNNKNILKRPGDTGNRPESTLVDFVGHLWCFKKEWLHYMFSIKPYTYDTGEDMHFCYSSKILGNISSYVGKQIGNGLSDTTNNRLAGDEFASFKTTSSDLRKSVENYFIKKTGNQSF